MSLLSKRLLQGLVWLFVALAGFAAWLYWPAAPISVAASASATAATADPMQVERGRYLALLGNCQACHTPRGGAPYAGGRGIATPFGTVYSSNLTPSSTGLGAWTADDFWRALHFGQSRDGHWLYPAFPFTNTTHIARVDSDALYAYLHSLAPQTSTPVAHAVRWPFNSQAALKLWRVLYFQEGGGAVALAADAAENDRAELARGAYLVRGLAHCGACHAPRNALGANDNAQALVGGLIPVQNWYAPSLTNPLEAGLQDWTTDDIVALFATGRARNAMVTGPMSDVVQSSMQHWKSDDLRAVAAYLKQLPRTILADNSVAQDKSTRTAADGAQLYKKHCSDCHGEDGQGHRATDGGFAYPPLAGNRTVTIASPVNLVQIVLNGGFAPATAGHPRPFGMPPFVLSLDDNEIASVVTYVRNQWGNHAPAVSALRVLQLRGQ